MERLAKPNDFALCYKKGRVYKGKLIVVYARANSLSQTRVGFSVSKKLGNAVKRNKVKRRLRAAVQQVYGQLATGFDVVIAARMSATAADFVQLQTGVHEALRCLNLRAEG